MFKAKSRGKMKAQDVISIHEYKEYQKYVLVQLYLH